ncbi:flagellar hook assembly protein FlgD [Endozoicomonas montiporae]|uniref:Basal-body rod modification protein FlgD n=1 Tax=Endozoicomonas montiporae CL-33 TaxID=570277 RepID=A0A142BCA0_9GAMM|nr:flagellar hook assembly protein FlgD [Endozoicomonas montiporae]AMO56376.1 flagellar basal body rod modification protein [Endozoicomonas montiporae CL-33]
MAGFIKQARQITAGLLLGVVAVGSANASMGLDSEAFLQMLLTQLQYQDPTAPMDNAQMVSQLADLTMMEQNAELVHAMNQLRDQMYQSQGLYASNLVGKEVMVIANLFKVENGRLPSGEILLNYAASDLNLEIYKQDDEPKDHDPVDTLKLGEQTESGKVPYDLNDLKKSLEDDTYMMYAYAEVDGSDLEQAVVQRSVVLSVVIPGGGQDVLVDVKGIGLVPLYSITEFQGDYVAGGGDGGQEGQRPERPGQLPSLPEIDPFASVAGHMEKTMRDGERWTINPFHKPQSMRSNERQKSQPVSHRDAMFRRVR